jgi:Secretion system C-terminal sorting domain/CARDB/Carboxypeptidase regulatory-like domain
MKKLILLIVIGALVVPLLALNAISAGDNTSKVLQALPAMPELNNMQRMDGLNLDELDEIIFGPELFNSVLEVTAPPFTPWSVVMGGDSAGTWMNSGEHTYNSTYCEFTYLPAITNGIFMLINSDLIGGGHAQSDDLVSPEFDLSGFATATLSFDSEQPAAYSDVCEVYISVDGANWDLAWAAAGAHAEVVEVDLEDYLDETNVTIKFHYEGAFSSGWGVDNVTVQGIQQVTGMDLEISSFFIFPEYPGVDDDVTVELFVVNNGLDNVTADFDIDLFYDWQGANPPVPGVDSGDFSWTVSGLASLNSITLTTTMTYQETGEKTIFIMVDADAGIDESNEENNLTEPIMLFVLGDIDVLLWDNDENIASARDVAGYLETSGFTTLLVTDITALNLSFFDYVFAFHGMVNWDPMTTSEVSRFMNYLNDGGKAYIGGGDNWVDATMAPLRPYFGVASAQDGGDDLVNMNGADGTITDGMQFVYEGVNSYVDHVNGLPGSHTIFTNPDQLDYVCGQLFDAHFAGVGEYKTALLTFELGGLVDGANGTKAELVDSLMAWLGRPGEEPNYGIISGTVYEEEIGGTPLEGVFVHMDAQVETTGDDGTYSFSDLLVSEEYDLKFEKLGYFTEYFNGATVQPGDITVVDMAMVYPEMSITPDTDLEITVDVSETGDSTASVTFDITNDGTGLLTWYTRMNIIEAPFASPAPNITQDDGLQLDELWDPLLHFDVCGPDPAIFFFGVAVVGEEIIAAECYYKYFRKFDLDGNFIEDIPMPEGLAPDSLTLGIIGLTTDGVYLYGGNSEGNLYKFLPDFSDITLIGNIGEEADALCYDWDANMIYANNPYGTFISYNVASGRTETLTMSPGAGNVYGMSYMPFSDDGYSIYMIGSTGYMSKYNPTTSEFAADPVHLFDTGAGEAPSGLCINNCLNEDRWDAYVIRRGDIAVIDVLEGFPEVTPWLYLSESDGTLDSDESTSITLNVDLTAEHLGFTPQFTQEGVGGAELTFKAILLDDSRPITVIVQVVSSGTETGSDSDIPEVYALHQNYPNPFNPSTDIRFDLVENQMVRLSVFDLLGREVATLIKEHMAAGTHSVQFEASSLASGIYFYRIEAGAFVDMKKMILIK